MKKKGDEEIQNYLLKMNLAYYWWPIPFILVFFFVAIGLLTVIFPESTKQLGLLKGLGYSLVYSIVSVAAAQAGFLFCWFILIKPRLHWLKDRILETKRSQQDGNLITEHICRESKESVSYGIVLQNLIGQFAT